MGSNPDRGRFNDRRLVPPAIAPVERRSELLNIRGATLIRDLWYRTESVPEPGRYGDVDHRERLLLDTEGRREIELFCDAFADQLQADKKLRASLTQLVRRMRATLSEPKPRKDGADKDEWADGWDRATTTWADELERVVEGG